VDSNGPMLSKKVFLAGLLRQLPGVLDEKLSGRIQGAVFQADDANAAQGNMQIDWNGFQDRVLTGQS
jgi:hypothetical protein